MSTLDKNKQPAVLSSAKPDDLHVRTAVSTCTLTTSKQLMDVAYVTI